MALGFEKAIVKNGIMILHFVYNQKSSYYRSDRFASVLRYVTSDGAKFNLRQGAGNIWDTSIWLAIAGLRGDEHVPGRNQVIFTPALLFGIFIRIFAPIAIIICFMNVIGWINLT